MIQHLPQEALRLDLRGNCSHPAEDLTDTSSAPAPPLVSSYPESRFSYLRNGNKNTFPACLIESHCRGKMRCGLSNGFVAHSRPFSAAKAASPCQTSCWAPRGKSWLPPLKAPRTSGQAALDGGPPRTERQAPEQTTVQQREGRDYHPRLGLTQVGGVTV